MGLHKNWANKGIDLHSPNSFINQVIFFVIDSPTKKRHDGIITYMDIFIDQIDTKLIEESSEEELYDTQAKFFYKS